MIHYRFLDFLSPDAVQAAFTGALGAGAGSPPFSKGATLPPGSIQGLPSCTVGGTGSTSSTVSKHNFVTTRQNSVSNSSVASNSSAVGNNNAPGNNGLVVLASSALHSSTSERERTVQYNGVQSNTALSYAAVQSSTPLCYTPVAAGISLSYTPAVQHSTSLVYTSVPLDNNIVDLSRKTRDDQASAFTR